MPEPSVAGMYSPLPTYDTSYISPPAPVYTGQYLNPNAATYSAPTTGTADFEDEPPLLEGINCNKCYFGFQYV